MRIRILTASAALAAALVIPAIPAVAEEGGVPPVTTVVEDLRPGTADVGGVPSPTPVAVPNDLGWG